MKPPVSAIRQDDTHRLIPSAYSTESPLARLTDRSDALDELIELEGATNDRLLGEANLLPGISIHELVFGIQHSDIVNAAFTHAHPQGSRFNGPERGAWYAAFDLRTARLEVAFHKTEELGEISWSETETFEFDDYLADFRADFHDIRNHAESTNLLAAVDYTESQRFARALLASGSAGIVYPSARHSKGTCIVCFRPALVTNVRHGRKLAITVKPQAR